MGADEAAGALKCQKPAYTISERREAIGQT